MGRFVTSIQSSQNCYEPEPQSVIFENYTI